jgi:hypothetical protein
LRYSVVPFDRGARSIDYSYPDRFCCRVVLHLQKATTASVFDAKEMAPEGLAICYPFGATLKIVKPATPLLTSGALSFPSNRPLCAFNRVCPFSLT